MGDSRQHFGDERRLRYPRRVPIHYLDREFPDGSYVGDGDRLVGWTDDVSAQLAQEAMLLAQGAERAREMLDAAARHERERAAPRVA